MRHDTLVDAIGNTPAVRLRTDTPDGVEVYAKLELLNPYAMKDRVARRIILEARRTGALREGAPIVESSSGTMALGVALVGTYLGHPVHIVTDPRIDPVTLAKLEAMGCSVHIVEAMTAQGWQSARLERLADLMRDLPGAWWPQQYSNPDNPAAYRTLADELLDDLGTVDVLVGSVGSGGSLCGTSAALLEHLPDLKVVGVDCVGSVLFGQPDLATRKQSGLGNSLYPDNIDYRLFDEVHWLSDDEAFDATKSLAREQKIFAGNTSGSVYRVLTHLAAHAAPGTRLVGIMPDRGDRYAETVYRHEAAGPVATAPTEVPFGTTVHRWSYAAIPRRHRPVLFFVESNTTGTGMLALRTATRLGLAPVLLTKDPARYAGLEETGCPAVRCDTEDEAALRAAADSAAAGRPVAGVTTTSDFYLVHAAALAGSFRRPGHASGTAGLCRDKSLSRAVLSEAGVPQPAHAVVESADGVAAAVARVGLPCVVKPADGSGSQDVRWCADEASALAQAARILAVTENVRGQRRAGRVLVEEFAQGPEYSVEMFCAGGEAVCVGITQRTTTALPYFVETGHLFPAVLSAAAEAELAESARQALKAGGFELGPAHVEVRLAPAGPVVIEVNGRLAGGMIPELIRAATGIDLLEQQLRAATGRPLALSADRARYAGLRFLTATETGRLTGITGATEAARVPGVESVVTTGVPGRAVRPPQDAYDRLGHVVAVGSSPREVETALDTATALIRVETTPTP
ncbi:ATP-grasp domain-containing protein [Streptomyces olivaceus]|uniref:pyridoxal-phosphate dependent enzyme n=1 Tax=Streptomyces olivaceus TaxID=47716 RepID=UPI001CCBE825|nr:pyridoxal-phosphate dependent enzyme [Streptomyces olivaceus]MBZ6295575.1 ATP-grasp domain-containing protein [Streptomyces olivaceus]MBZ6330539.1 ATP-grasp domain-containing protein [Streptomyces olivaceus]